MWHIQNVQVKADVLTLDSQMYEAFEKKISSGARLKIPFSSYMTQSQVVSASGKNITVNVSRAFSELRSLFATLWAPPINDNMAKWMKPWNFLSCNGKN